jgi:hypothetical protein
MEEAFIEAPKSPPKKLDSDEAKKWTSSRGTVCDTARIMFKQVSKVSAEGWFDDLEISVKEDVA